MIVIPAVAKQAKGNAVIALRICYVSSMGDWVYVMSHRAQGVLYIGVTADLPA